MKKFLLYLSAAVFVLAGCAKDYEAASSNEDIDGFLQEVFWEQVEVPKYEVIDEGEFTPDELVDAAFGTKDNLDEEELKIKELFLKRCEEKQKELEEEYPYGAPAFQFNRLKFNYTTIDQNGEEIELSAFMGWAVIIVFGVKIKYDQNHILFCCPYTHTKEDECATESNLGLGGGIEFLSLWHDDLFIMPDGQGFGKNKNNVQTYLNHDLHAKQYYDALVVGHYLYENKIKGKLEKDWTLRVVGASQGAGDGIALHKYLDKTYKRLDLTGYYKNGNRKRANELCKQHGYPEGTPIIESPFRLIHRFEYSYVCCGPYCPEATMQKYSEWGKMSYPCVIPLVIKSMLACYYDFLCIQKGYREQDFFSRKWNSNKDDFDKIYLNKTMESEYLNKYLFDKLEVDKKKYSSPMVPLDSLLSKEMLDTASNIYKDFMSCLKKQDLTRGWTPRTKTKLQYSRNDEVVPYVNTDKLEYFFSNNGHSPKMVEYSWYDGLHSIEVGHVGCCFNYIAGSWDW